MCSRGNCGPCAAVAVAIVTAWLTAGCGLLGDECDMSFAPRCEGNTHVFCGYWGDGWSQIVKRSDCGTSVCVEKNGQAACVLPSLTPCAGYVAACSDDGRSTLACALGYATSSTDCAPHEVCVSKSGVHAYCVDAPATPCSSESCSVDQRRWFSCARDVGYVHTQECLPSEVCAAVDGYARCVDGSLTPCTRASSPGFWCTDDKHGVVDCNFQLGYLEVDECRSGTACVEDNRFAECRAVE
jgi:hypothetical protein